MSSSFDDVLGGDAGAAASSRTPPYVSFATLVTFLKALKTDGLPPQIDKSVLSKLSGGVQGQMKLALRSLGLMVDGDKPTDELEKLVNSVDTADFDAVLLERLQATYPYVFALDLMTATPTMLADAFKGANKDAKEDVLRKCRTFFLHAAKKAGVPLGNRILTGSVPRSPSNGTRRKAKARPPETQQEVEKPDEGKDKVKKSGKDHPLVDGLLLTLPDPGKKWDIDARVSWLRMAAFIFENIYDGKGSIDIKKIETEKSDKKAATD